MALTQSAVRNSNGISFTYITDSSADWPSVPINTYFKDLGDGLVHYKDSAGNIQEIFSSSGITVGTTAVTSGTDGKVFFQAGGVVQQDAGFLWDTTNKRMQLLGTGVIASPALNSVLEIKAKNNSDIVFRVRNSTDTRNFLTVNGAGDVFNNGAQGVSGNAFFGENTGRSTTGLYNCFFGLEAGRDNSTGTNNSFFGVEAGRVNSSASFNSFYGIQAGRSTTTGSYNSFFGSGAGYSNGGGTYNAFFGNAAGSGNTSGSYNSCFGFASGEFHTTGSENVFLGVESGRRISSGSNLTVATNSIFIGGLSRANANSESNQIVIGHSAIGLGSNTTVIGNSSTTLFRPYGNVAIGANTASARLDVRAADGLSNLAFRVRNSVDTDNIIAVQGDANIVKGSTAAIVSNVQSVVSAATVTPVYGNDLVKITAQAAALTLANPTGTWTEGKDLMIRIKDDGLGARAITWDTNYRAIGVTLPAITVLGKTTYVGVIYNSDDAKWDVIGVTTQA